MKNHWHGKRDAAIRSFIRDLVPYGLAIRYAARSERLRSEAFAAERSRALRLPAAVSGNTKRLPRLNMGCGSHLEPNWWNLDASEASDLQIWWDENATLPFEQDSLEIVFSEHFIEHISLNAGIHFCREAGRVLRPGGIFRCSTPNFDWIVNSANNNGWQKLMRVYEQIGDFPPGTLVHPSQVINWAFHGHGHQFIWSLADFKDHLKAAGFRDIRQVRSGETRLPGAAIEIRTSEEFCSLTVEATWH